MKYIIFDLEWNQPSTKKEKTDSLAHGEIIQLGFIVLDQSLEIVFKDNIVIKPVCYTNMNKYVSALTGLDQTDIDNGICFKESFGRMTEYFDNDTVMITWGDDDIPILKDNLKFHNITHITLPKHYNLQRIFSAQTKAENAQTGLKTAVEHFGIDIDIQAHDALNDAYMTVLVARKLNLEQGIAEYGKVTVIKQAKSSQQPWFYNKPLYYSSCEYTGGFDGMAAFCRKIPFFCPVCGKPVSVNEICKQGKAAFISTGECEHEDSFFVRFILKENKISTTFFNSNDDFERVYNNKLKQKEKRSKYRAFYKKSSKKQG